MSPVTEDKLERTVQAAVQVQYSAFTLFLIIVGREHIYCRRTREVP